MPSIPLTCVVGARPNFVKMAAILEAASRRPALRARLVHTGQHYSPEMARVFFDELALPEPDAHLGVGSGSHAGQTAEMMRRIEPELEAHPPACVVVVGDVNSTLAAALTAVKMGIPVAHVEAGLRSFDRSMPEEINRLATDAVSDYLFASEPSGVDNLKREGVDEERIFFAGNVMIDTLLRFRERAGRSAVLERLGVEPRRYVAVTLHRPSNVDDPGQLEALLELLDEAAGEIPVIFPAHPRTRARMGELGLGTSRVRIIEPLGYLDFLQLESQARLVMTDSGGIQEETTILGVPCLTLRENTERPVTIEKGTNRLAGRDPATIRRLLCETLDAPPKRGEPPELWDGHAGERVAGALERLLG